MRELFVYYRVPAGHALAALERIRGIQSRLRCEHPALQARLLRRADADAADRETWMEAYATDPRLAPAGVDAALEAAIEQCATALLPLLDGPRHTEAFVAA